MRRFVRDDNHRQHTHHRPPFRVRVGSDFDLTDAPTVEARARGFIAKAVVLFVGVAVAVSASHGLLNGNYTALEVVWAVAGPFVGAVVTYYFGMRGFHDDRTDLRGWRT